MAMIMAAGSLRLLTWKEQQLENRPVPVVEHSDYEQPLKPPPHGLQWHQLDDQEWELRIAKSTQQADEDDQHEQEDQEQPEDEDDTALHDDTEDEEKAQEGTNSAGAQGDADVPKFLEHVVLPEDTLAGICIRYKVKDRELRRLNGFVGNHFRTCGSLIVPNNLDDEREPKKQSIDELPQAKPKLLPSLSVSSRLETSEAKHYLASNKWDLDNAPKERRTERAWKSQREIYEAPSLSTPQPRQGPLLPPTPRNWLPRRGLRLLGKYAPRAAPVGRFKTGPARRLHRSTSNMEGVSGTPAESSW